MKKSHFVDHPLFAVTTFLSAFLLFQIQPLISRYILPWFGGTPAVWSAALVFFQMLLLCGYGYAHKLVLGGKRSIIIHLALLGVSLIVLLTSTLFWGTPLLPDSSWKPPDASMPLIRIIVILSVSIGLPYFILASTSPLLQAWVKRLTSNYSPYRLYAISNLGSFLALISYPLIFEFMFTLRQQAGIWSLAYISFTALCFYLSIKMFRSSDKNMKMVADDSPQVAPPHFNHLPSRFQKFFWLALPACTSILLLSVSNQITQEIAVIPFLWVLPLALYLLSFTITFSGDKWYLQSTYLFLLGGSSLLLSYALDNATIIGVFPQVVIFSLFLLAATLTCHGELYRLRPDPKYLTSYYLFISFGGALGGLFVNLVAPIIFQGYWELHFAVLFTWLLFIVLLITNKNSIFHHRTVWVAAPMALVFLGITSFVLVNHIKNILASAMVMERNFYGVIRVREITLGEPPLEALSLSHGITSHGSQYIQPDRRTIPTAYYGSRSGIGLALANYPKLVEHNPSTQGLKIGVVGLGAGTLAAYGKNGDIYRFYEINPAIISLALGEGDYFSYLKDTPAAFDIISGDARVSLEAEFEQDGTQAFDILALDAFSGDAIPIHLLTLEAFDLYLRHLKPQGVLAIHISNRYLDLAPLVQSAGRFYKLEPVLIASPANDNGSYAAVWVLLSNNKEFFRLPDIQISARKMPEEVADPRLWTDNYSNLLPLLRMGVFFRIR
ncbi:MAG: hypothetical protein JSV61_03245 [Anaerolineales bacterium]|nr:MAG: hypothetical protein JSV61_03245 [Anaerolineales bacterium]